MRSDMMKKQAMDSLFYQVEGKRLRDYENYIPAKQGFNGEIINELNLEIKDFSDIKLFIVILFDEMKIQENLVRSKHTRELIGFANLGDICFTIFNKKYCQPV